MHIRTFTLFPELIEAVNQSSIVGRATQQGLVSFSNINVRNYATDVHKTVDDSPFGGSPGMVLRCQELDAALNKKTPLPGSAVIFFDPSGVIFKQSDARSLSCLQEINFVCGHYEGIDQRIVDKWATHVFSIGDFVLTGGEIPALLVTDAVVRLLEGSLGNAISAQDDSHTDGLLSYPSYTRPQNYEGLCVPDVLTSGNHDAIRKWQRALQLRRTREARPDLFCTAPLSPNDLDLLQ